MKAEMGDEAYLDILYTACHADDASSDPVASWEMVRVDGQGIYRGGRFLV
jgi:hypothetical protein